MAMLPLPPDATARAWGYDDFLREGLSLLPAWAPGWTDHNASDPGIALLELLAYVADILHYRALRISPDARLEFLRLLEGADGDAEANWRGRPAAGLDDAIRARVAALARPRCTVTPADFEREALAAAADQLGADTPVGARAIVGIDLSAAAHGRGRGAAAADVSVVLAPGRDLAPAALAGLCRAVEAALAPRCLLTTRVHVVAPVVLRVAVGAAVALADGTTLDDAAAAIDAALQRRFGPTRPGDTGAPRPLGRPLFVSELVEVVDAADGIDWVETVELRRIGAGAAEDDPDALVGLRIGSVATLGLDARLGGGISRGARRLQRDAGGEVVSLRLEPWEQLRVTLARDALRPVADDAGGGRA